MMITEFSEIKIVKDRSLDKIGYYDRQICEIENEKS